jgi:microsomal dipeptidase-like Zn-dependent dipeptidase
VLIDLSHMSGKSIEDTFGLLGRLEKGSEPTPVLFTHAGFRLGEQEYMLDRETVEEVHRRKGAIGLIMARHQIEDRIPKREKPPRLPRRSRRRFQRSFGILCEHIEEIHRITGSYENIALGSDFDGFIKPTLGGLHDMRDMARLERRLREHYGEEIARQVCSANALRPLETYWGGSEGPA